MLRAVNRQDVKYVSGLLANEYVLTFVIFMIWLLFFDKNNLITQAQLQDTIDQLVDEKTYYDSELTKLSDRMHSIQVDRERYARETFYLHRSDEIVYLVR
jgi:cell division protein FtsB